MFNPLKCKSLCSQPLMNFVDKYRQESPDYNLLAEVSNDFVVQCVSSPIDELSFAVRSPTFAREVEKMIATYDWYITNRFWGFQLLYPVVSFLRVYYSIILHSSDEDLYERMLQAYYESLFEDVI